MTMKLPLIRSALLGSALALAFAPQSAQAQQVYGGTFTALNGSGVSGTTTLTLSDDHNFLTVLINATGLEAGGPHVGHIHGLEDSSGMPIDSTTPTLAQDGDGDGYIELAEGAMTYGPILVPFGNVDPDMDGIVNFSQTFDLFDPATYMAGFDIYDLLGPDLNQLNLREIVLHGMTVPQGPGADTPGEVNGENGYLAVLPIASAEISAVPEPATWAMMLMGFGAIGFSVRRRRARALAA